jgi:hypothetical protein
MAAEGLHREHERRSELHLETASTTPPPSPVSKFSRNIKGLLHPCIDWTSQWDWIHVLSENLWVTTHFVAVITCACAEAVMLLLFLLSRLFSHSKPDHILKHIWTCSNSCGNYGALLINEGGRSVGIVRSRTKGHGVCFLFVLINELNTCIKERDH